MSLIGREGMLHNTQIGQELAALLVNSFPGMERLILHSTAVPAPLLPFHTLAGAPSVASATTEVVQVDGLKFFLTAWLNIRRSQHLNSRTPLTPACLTAFWDCWTTLALPTWTYSNNLASNSHQTKSGAYGKSGTVYQLYTLAMAQASADSPCAA